MADQLKRSSIFNLASGILGFVSVVGLGSLVILHHGGAAAKPHVVPYASVDAGAASRAPEPGAVLSAAPLAPSQAPVSSPAPLIPSEALVGAAAAAPTPAAPAAAASGDVGIAAAANAAPKLVVGRHLEAASSASSSASASVAAAPKSKASAASPKKAFLPPKLDLSKDQGIVASRVHYGVSSRAELMGRAAGPVYNFAGRGAGQALGAQIAAGSAGAAGAIRQVNDAQKQIDASDVPADEKAKLDKNLDAVRQTAAAVPAPPAQ
jgi:hypothetical protein